ncbi:alginate O-acetyltransferase AlgX-related protein [Aureispira anguillae]|uniref:AlgX/AlgJ SGNH hydrolase-like domain-containing protein n=1 Tax=Aureispira anguillae TaxID=2864201 RepID=A0A915YEZ3_9BACT|nr:hypothetical protein [Aureispira anguillae]BDS11897.1 hypothetical protein AsAng_0026110 [Aureispira anguillae]
MKRKEKITRSLFYVLLLLLFVPMLQANIKWIKVNKLGGYDVPPTDITVTKELWLNGAYQTQKEKYIKTHFGFCNWAIRAEHQLAYWAYGMSRVNGLIMGKENYLYEISYINTRNGQDYLGDDRLSELAEKAKAVQDTMRAMGKAFFFVVAPNKADYYAEYLPDQYARPQGDLKTNYTTFKDQLKQYGINHIDINNWFLSMKDTTSIPLYGPMGIHYTTYGAGITAQRIFGEIERQLGKDIPDFYWEHIDWDTNLRGSDDDLEKALNLALKIPTEALAYPRILINKENKYKPRIITIGDSFFWQLVNMGIAENVFDNGQFWYYNREVYPGQKNFAEVNIGAELAATDGVFIIMTPPNMKKYLGPFIEQLYNFYYDQGSMNTSMNAKIQQKMKEIRATEAWLKAVEEKAKINNVSLDEMIYLDAKFVVEQETN